MSECVCVCVCVCEAEYERTHAGAHTYFLQRVHAALQHVQAVARLRGPLVQLGLHARRQLRQLLLRPLPPSQVAAGGWVGGWVGGFNHSCVCVCAWLWLEANAPGMAGGDKPTHKQALGERNGNPPNDGPTSKSHGHAPSVATCCAPRRASPRPSAPCRA